MPTITKRKSKITKKKSERRPISQECIAMGINMSLFNRLFELEKVTDTFAAGALRDAGLIITEKVEGEEVIAGSKFSQYDSFVGFIEDKLNLNFFDATRWLLNFIESTPPSRPESTECRCEEDGIDCDH